LSIKQDHARFRKIVRGRIRKNLRKYMSRGEMIGRRGKGTITIPIPQIDIPRFRYGSKESGGVGQGEGDPGDAIAPGEGTEGSGQAGSEGGEHVLEVEVSLEELAEIMAEELELPRLTDKGSEKLVSTKDRYVGIKRSGPESLRHFKRTYKEALKRQIATGSYDPDRPVIIPVKEDRRYRSWRTDEVYEANAVIIYMMDVSGSMGDEQKEVVRMASFWIDTWLKSNYKGLERVFIIHDAVAREVDEDTFFHTRESGGTMISSAYILAQSLIDERYPPNEWNIYPFHFSDGDNWSADDTRKCTTIMKQSLMPQSNVFCYGQVHSPYGSGQFIKDLKEEFEGEDRLITAEIPSRDEIMDAIKTFLGKAR